MAKVSKSKHCWSNDMADHAKCKFGTCQCPCHKPKLDRPTISIVEAARSDLITTLGDLIERYDYEIVRDALWTLKPDTSGQLWCGDCGRYVNQAIHGCSRELANHEPN